MIRRFRGPFKKKKKKMQSFRFSKFVNSNQTHSSLCPAMNDNELAHIATTIYRSLAQGR